MYDGKELEEGEICEHSDTEHPVKNESMQNSNSSIGDHLKKVKEEEKEEVVLVVGVTNNSTTLKIDMDVNPGAQQVVQTQVENISDPNVKSEMANINNVITQPELIQQKLEEVFPVVEVSFTTSQIENTDILQSRQEVNQQQFENKNDGPDSGINNIITVSEIDTTPQELTQQPLKETDMMDPNRQERSTSSEVEDIDVLLCRHELIRQQLNIVNAKDVTREETNICEKVSKKKRKGKKKRKNKPIMGNSISLSLISPIKNNDKDNFTFRKSLSVPDKLGDEIDEELLTLRNEALSHSLNKSQINNDNFGLIKKSEKKMKVKNNFVNKNSNIRTHEKDSTFKLSNISAKQINNEGNQRYSKPLQNELLKSLSFTNAWNMSSKSKSRFVHGGSHGHENITQVKSSTKKRRKMGKRERKWTPINPTLKMTKSKGYLAYSEQQEREVKILRKQQEEMAFDNYSNIPMEIDDDDVSVNADDIVAPLPLIEMPEVRPPLPPGDDFRPVYDQASLCMTRTNVAWMPGFVESLDTDVNALSPKVGVNQDVNQEVAKVIKIETNAESAKTEEYNGKEDDEDVWALRAQALKSLACKRAVRAKELNKNKKMKSVQAVVTKEKIVKIENIPSPRVSSPVIPAVMKHTTIVNKRKSYNIKPPPPPKHPKVIIQLRKEDFESGSDEEEHGYNNGRQVKFKVVTRRRKSGFDETLLKDLQGCIKRCRVRMKKNSSSIVKDQLIYKKLQNEISKQKILHEEQKENVKHLQDELQLAIKQKISTCKMHSKLHEKIKNIKDQLKEKIQVRNATDERILRAKSIVSVNRLHGNAKGNINNRLKDQISTLMESLRESYQALLNAEKSSDMSLNNIVKLSQENHRSEIQNGHAEILNKIDIGSINDRSDLSSREGTTGSLHGNDLVQVDHSPLEEIKNDDDTSKECQASSKDTNASGLLSDLVELKKLFTTSNKPSETSCITYTLLELLQGLGDAESLKVIQIQSENNCNTAENVELLSRISNKKSYKQYKTPLSRFKSYRLSPKFTSHSMFSIRSPTFSNEIQPCMTICQYDLLGTCNDNNCAHTHLDEKCVISTHGLVNDLLSYCFNNIDGYEEMNAAARQHHLNLYTNQFMTKYGGKLSLDKSTTFIWDLLKEFCLSKKREISDSVILKERDWFYQEKYNLNEENEECNVDHYTSKYDIVYFLNQKMKNIKESQEIRYFSKKYNSLELLKERLGENPSDVKLWLTLVQQILNSDKSNDKSAKQCYKLSSNVREYALSVLSQGLEENASSEDLWIQYLKLFSMNHSIDELRELCYQAVMYAANYNVWWTCLSLETTVFGKQEICAEMIKFIKESNENATRKSHNLTETILYATQLLSCCGKLDDAKHYLNIALGIKVECNKLNGNSEKLHIADIPENLNRIDKSLLWLCLISVHTFNNLPKCIFCIEESGPGRLVNKENFLLDWQNGSWNSSEEEIRLLFNDALHIEEDRSISVLKDLIILYENIVAFELSLGNIESAVAILQDLVSEHPSFVDGWRLLLLLYIQFFPTDDVIIIGEKAINNCATDAVLVYFFSKLLLKKDLADLALEKLKKCIHGYFGVENDEMKSCVAEMYQKVIKLSLTSHSVVYYCLCYCLLVQENLQMSSVTSQMETSEAFEYVIHQYNSPENTKTLWMAYIEYKANYLSNMKIISSEEYQSFVDLLFQSLASISAIGVVKENTSLYWRDYEFHNKVVDMCLAIIPIHEHSKLYQKLINFMPDNIPLALRICNHEFEGNNYEQARIICNYLLSEFPNCLPLWEMAIKIELKCENIKEARWLLKEATKALPFCSTLWKQLAKFEVFHSADFNSVTDKFEEITYQISIYGIDVHEVLPKLT